MTAPQLPHEGGQEHPARNGDHAERLEDLASYVLGALSAEERDEVRRHLPSCAVCQTELIALAPLPALLNRSRPDPAASLPPMPVPAFLRERVVNQVVTARRTERRRRGALVAAASITVLALGGTLVGVARTSSPVAALGPVVAFRPMTTTSLGNNAKADVAVDDHTWGTAITVRGTGWDIGKVSVISIVTRGGGVERVGSWTGTGSVALTCRASTWHRVAELKVVQVRDTSGHVLAELPVQT